MPRLGQKRNAVRDIEIIRLFENGEKRSTIARNFNLTLTRIGQIIDRGIWMRTFNSATKTEQKEMYAAFLKTRYKAKHPTKPRQQKMKTSTRVAK